MTTLVSAALVLLSAAWARAAWLAGPSAVVRHRLVERRPVAAAWGPPPRLVHIWATRAGLAPDLADQSWPAIVAVVITGVVGSAVLFGWPGLVLACLALAAGPFVVAERLAARMRIRRQRALPGLLEDVARALRSGASLRQAMQLSVDRADPCLVPDLRAIRDELAHGARLEDVLDAWCKRQPADGLRLAVAALTLGIDAGGAHGKALDGVAASLRDRLAVDRELAALSSQARASAVVMAAAPLLFAVIAAAADPRTAHFFLGTSEGLFCLTTGLALDAIAAWWMTRLTGAIKCPA